MYGMLSVHEWNPNSHSGYLPESVDYLLDAYPYRPIRDHDSRAARNSISISVSPDRETIIVSLAVAGRAYGFHSALAEGKNGLRLADMPEEVLERD